MNCNKTKKRMTSWSIVTHFSALISDLLTLERTVPVCICMCVIKPFHSLPPSHIISPLLALSSLSQSQSISTKLSHSHSHVLSLPQPHQKKKKGTKTKTNHVKKNTKTPLRKSLIHPHPTPPHLNRVISIT